MRDHQHLDGGRPNEVLRGDRIGAVDASHCLLEPRLCRLTAVHSVASPVVCVGSPVSLRRAAISQRMYHKLVSLPAHLSDNGKGRRSRAYVELLRLRRRNQQGWHPSYKDTYSRASRGVARSRFATQSRLMYLHSINFSLVIGLVSSGLTS